MFTDKKEGQASKNKKKTLNVENSNVDNKTKKSISN